jgi:hypothetical protein
MGTLKKTLENSHSVAKMGQLSNQILTGSFNLRVYS